MSQSATVTERSVALDENNLERIIAEGDKVPPGWRLVGPCPLDARLAAAEAARIADAEAAAKGAAKK